MLALGGGCRRARIGVAVPRFRSLSEGRTTALAAAGFAAVCWMHALTPSQWRASRLVRLFPCLAAASSPAPMAPRYAALGLDPATTHGTALQMPLMTNLARPSTGDIFMLG